MSSKSNPSGDSEPNFAPDGTSTNLYELFETEKWQEIKNFLDNTANFDVNAALVTSGPLAGYTALHLACLKRNPNVLIQLINDHNADVHVTADDGAQPIHLVSSFGLGFVNRILLDKGADVNAKVTKDIRSKYKEFQKWSNEFGDTVSLLTFALYNFASDVANTLLDYDVDVTAVSLNNKTLLMYALEQRDYSVAMKIADTMTASNPELINARDNAGWHAFHYLLDKRKYGTFRYDEGELMTTEEKGKVVKKLIEAGADIDATIHGDPDTLLFNMAAYRACYPILKQLMPHCTSLKGSKALSIATRQPDDQEGYLQVLYDYPNDFSLVQLEKDIQQCDGLVLTDLVNRRTFGLYVPSEEKKSMDQLIANQSSLKEFVDNYKKKFIHGYLKNQIIYYDDKNTTLYEVLMRAFDKRLVKVMIKDEKLVEAVKSLISNENRSYLVDLLVKEIERAGKRNKLMEDVKKIPQLKDCILLPYEIVLDIIDYLENDNLKVFISAFYCDE